jgi:hypothetical protein
MYKYRTGRSAMFQELRAHWQVFRSGSEQEDFFYQAWVFPGKLFCNHTRKLDFEQQYIRFR